MYTRGRWALYQRQHGWETTRLEGKRKATDKLGLCNSTGVTTVWELDLTLVQGTKRKNSTGARPHPCTREPGGRTVQELDLTLVQGTRRKNSTGARPHSCTRNQEEEQYRSQTSFLYKEPGGRTVQEPDLTLAQGIRRKNSMGARPHSCTRNGDEEQYRS